MHDQEKLYSPPLRSAGGYSYEPSPAYEPSEPHIYNPDAECPEDYVPPQEQQAQQGNDRKGIIDRGTVVYPNRGKLFDIKGRPR
jgi:hypothetical protein